MEGNGQTRAIEPGYLNQDVTKVPGWHGLVAWDLLFNNLTTGLFLFAAVGELASPDFDASSAFYGGLFGWEADDQPVDESTVYSMQNIDGKPVAAIAPQQQAQRDAGVPPLWQSYLTVESADAAAAKAAQLGATIHAPAFDVMDAGRMAVMMDPQGAHFMVWEPKQHIGANLVNGHGLLSWNELATPDVAASSAFYADLFGWVVTPMEGMGTEYSTIANSAGHGNGGSEFTIAAARSQSAHR